MTDIGLRGATRIAGDLWVVRLADRWGNGWEAYYNAAAGGVVRVAVRS